MAGPPKPCRYLLQGPHLDSHHGSGHNNHNHNINISSVVFLRRCAQWWLLYLHTPEVSQSRLFMLLCHCVAYLFYQVQESRL